MGNALVIIAFIRGVLDLTMAIEEILNSTITVPYGFESSIGTILFSIFSIVIYITASIASLRLFVLAHSEVPRPFFMKYYILTALVIFCAVLCGIKYMSYSIGYTIVFFSYGIIVLALHIWLLVKKDKLQITSEEQQQTVVISSRPSGIPMFEMPIVVESAEVRETEPMNSIEDSKAKNMH